MKTQNEGQLPAAILLDLDDTILAYGDSEESVFRHMLERFDVTARDTWMVGDDLQRDISGVQALGLFTIWVDWREGGLPESSPIVPDRVVRSIAELQ